MISPRSQSESQYVPASQQQQQLPHVHMNANSHSIPPSETPSNGGGSVMQLQMMYHTQPGSTSSSVSSALSQGPPPSHPGLHNNNYTTSTNQGQVSGVPSFSLPSVTAPPGMGGFYYEQNPMAQVHYPGHPQPQPGPGQSMYFPPTSFPLMAQQPPPGPHEQYFSLAPHPETSSSTASLPTLTHTGSLPPSLQTNDDKPFPGVLDPQYHRVNNQPSTYHPRSHTYPSETTQQQKVSKRSSSASSTSGPLGMTEETARRNRCNICNKQFKRPSSLQTHLYSHTGEKPFQCEWSDCGRLFSVRSNMIRHRKLHERDSNLQVKDGAKHDNTQEQRMADHFMAPRQDGTPNGGQQQSNQGTQFANGSGMMPPLSWTH